VIVGSATGSLPLIFQWRASFPGPQRASILRSCAASVDLWREPAGHALGQESRRPRPGVMTTPILTSLSQRMEPPPIPVIGRGNDHLHGSGCDPGAGRNRAYARGNPYWSRTVPSLPMSATVWSPCRANLHNRSRLCGDRHENLTRFCFNPSMSSVSEGSSCAKSLVSQLQWG
jgi:hypothetical protein